MTVSIGEGNRRLLVLAEFLEKLPPERFDYGTWVGRNWAGAKDLSCGTRACALGWATTIPEFQEAGLCLIRDAYGDGVVRFNRGEPNRYQSSLDAGAAMFGLNEDESAFLFYPGEVLDDEDEPAPSDLASPSEVAAHIRKFVAGRAGK